MSLEKRVAQLEKLVAHLLGEVDTLKLRLAVYEDAIGGDEEDDQIDSLLPMRQLVRAQKQQEEQQAVQQQLPPQQELQHEQQRHEQQPDQLQRQEPPMTAREKVLQEFIRTEKTYVDNLQLLIALFVLPFTSSDILSAQDLAILFGNVDAILALNVRFLSEISADDANVAQLCINFAPEFHIYVAYCANLEDAYDRLRHLRNDTRFTEILATIKKLPDLRGKDLESLIAQPMQRITRYPLLIRELIKQTPEDHEELKEWTRALNKMKEMADMVNEGVRELEQSRKLMAIQMALVGYSGEALMNSGRYFCKEGFITKITSRFMIEDYYLLLSDRLIYCTKKGELFYVKGCIDLHPCYIRDLPNTSVLQNNFQLVAPKKTYTYHFQSEEEKVEWRDVMNEQIKKLVAADPGLVRKRGKVRIRRRGPLEGLLGLFTYAPSSFDPDSRYVWESGDTGILKEGPDEDLEEFTLIDESEHSQIDLRMLSQSVNVIINDVREHALQETDFTDANYWAPPLPEIDF